jgi:hypothetical protein
MEKLRHLNHKVKNTSRMQLLFYASIALCVLSFVMLLAALNIEQRRTSDSTPQKPFTTGSTIKQGMVAMSVDSVSYNAGTGAFTAPKGKHYAIISFTVKNRSDQQINVLPSSDTYMKDSAGNVVYLTPFTLDEPFHAGELPPGEQVKGQLSYLVPENTPMKLYVDAIWSGGVIPITIN